MDCERYQEWIRDAAAEMPGAAPRPDHPDRQDRQELTAHLAACLRCRAVFEQEQSLAAAIDRSLRASLASDPSPAFAASVRARLSEARVRPRSWLAGWAPVAAGALAAGLVMGFWLARKQKAESGRQKGVASVTRLEKQRSEVRSQKSVSQGLGTGGTGHGTARGDRMQAASRRRSSAGPDVEILVPKGQAAAVMQLYNSVWDPPQEETRAAGDGGQGTVAEATTKPLEIEPLKVEPLESSTLDAELSPPAPPESGRDGAKGSDR